MRSIRNVWMLAPVSTVAIGVAAWDEGITAPERETALLSVAPAGGAVDVVLNAPVVVTFDHAMQDHALPDKRVFTSDSRSFHRLIAMLMAAGSSTPGVNPLWRT